MPYLASNNEDLLKNTAFLTTGVVELKRNIQKGLVSQPVLDSLFSRVLVELCTKPELPKQLTPQKRQVYEGLLEVLIQNGADVTRSRTIFNPKNLSHQSVSEPLLMTACGKYGFVLRPDLLKQMLSFGARKCLDCQDQNGDTPAMILADRLNNTNCGRYIAAPNPCLQPVKMVKKALSVLLSFKQNVNLENKNQETLLHNVLYFPDITHKVLELGADSNHKMFDGWVPLDELYHFDFKPQKTIVCRDLLKAGANPFLMSNQSIYASSYKEDQKSKCLLLQSKINNPSMQKLFAFAYVLSKEENLSAMQVSVCSDMIKELYARRKQNQR